MPIEPVQLLSEHASFGGVQRFYQHTSSVVGLPMKFSVYLPPQANFRPVPALLYLAGLTCTEETFMAKAGAQRVAAERGLALIAPDTSPRGAGAPGEADNWDFGVGAGFYLDATQAPWSRHYRRRATSPPSCCRLWRSYSQWMPCAWVFSGIPWGAMVP
jgi:S-formylglutathione hydrolase